MKSKKSNSHLYQTPHEVAEYMVNMIPKYKTQRLVLEPTPGEGNLVTQINKRNDLICLTPFNNDFFLHERGFFYDYVVMNPPFSDKYCNLMNAPEDVNLKGSKTGYYILEKCMEMSPNIIALMPIWLITDSDVRHRKLIEFGLKSITLLPRKAFGYIRVQTAIFELRQGYKGNSIIKRFDY
jgi:type I restriction-modification system DNA methylase subunit